MTQALSSGTSLGRDAGRVTLSPHEMYVAACAGVGRRCQNIRDGRKDRHGVVKDPWDADVTGALGECAVAKFLGRYWTGALGNLKAADVGDIQVRSRTRPDGDLIVYPSDSQSDIFVLAVPGARPSEILLAGWLYGYEAKQAQYWLDPGTGRPNYFVPQSQLRPISTLRDVV